MKQICTEQQRMSGNKKERFWKNYSIKIPSAELYKTKYLQEKMNKILIIRAFEKATAELEKNGNKKPTKSDKAKEISDFIYRNTNFNLGERSFRDYYNGAKTILNLEEDIHIKQQQVIQGLCKYLSFDTYEEFKIDIQEPENRPVFENTKKWTIKNKWVIILIFFILTYLGAYQFVTRERWMVWEDGQYKEVDFDIEKYHINQLKIYKEDRVKYFKQIDPDCDYIFFDTDNTVRVWYGKNHKKQLEYFTDFGLHPETGKTLKPITHYMIDKYVCEVENEF